MSDLPAGQSWAHNVEAARAVGMHGIVVDADPSGAMRELVALVDRLS